MTEVRRLSGDECQQYLGALAGVLLDCVDGNASVSFLWPFSCGEAEEFYASVFDEVRKGKRILLAAFLDGELLGTVQIVTAMPPNQPHRADVAKLLVKRSARGHGVAAMLMDEAERAARSAGKTLLVLDTVVGGSAEKLYSRLGWTRVGVIPRYAMFPDRSWCDTAIFWKGLI